MTSIYIYISGNHAHNGINHIFGLFAAFTYIVFHITLFMNSWKNIYII